MDFFLNLSQNRLSASVLNSSQNTSVITGLHANGDKHLQQNPVHCSKPPGRVVLNFAKLGVYVRFENFSLSFQRERFQNPFSKIYILCIWHSLYLICFQSSVNVLASLTFLFSSVAFNEEASHELRLYIECEI